MVARLHEGHPGADLLDDAGPLVAQDGRERDIQLACNGVVAAVADAGRGDLYQDLS